MRKNNSNNNNIQSCWDFLTKCKDNFHNYLSTVPLV